MMKYLLMGTSSNFGNMFSMAAASVFLPFLPMLPTQILLNNLLYDVAQITIPTDRVDRVVHQPTAALGHALDSGFHAVRRPGQLAVRLSDVLRAAARAARDRAAVSHRLVRRVAGDADARAVRDSDDGESPGEPSERTAHGHDALGRRYRPGIACDTVGAAAWLHCPANVSYFGFLVAATLTYLVLVEVVKRAVVRRLLGADGSR